LVDRPLWLRKKGEGKLSGATLVHWNRCRSGDAHIRRFGDKWALP